MVSQRSQVWQLYLYCLNHMYSQTEFEIVYDNHCSRLCIYVSEHTVRRLARRGTSRPGLQKSKESNTGGNKAIYTAILDPILPR